MIQLHNYQQNLVQKAKEAYKQGYKSPCIVAPCGSGKSVIISEIAKLTTNKNNHVLFLVHRKELLDQIKETFEKNNVNLSLVNFAMIQTVVRKLNRIPVPKLIITDESHHGLALSYRKVYEYFPNTRRLSFTATPIRLNGGGLGDVNDILLEEVSAKWLIDNNYLSPYKYFAPKLIDTSKLKTRAGEFTSQSIEETFLTKKIYGDVVNHYKKLSYNQQAICYCNSIARSKEVAENFNANNIKAAHIDGNTSKAERDEIINQFRNGEIKILCNVDLIGEGFNVPDCSTVILLRPTKSLSLYIQQSMRGMRYKPNKTSIIIDHVGNVERFGLPDADRTWSLEPKVSKNQEKNEIQGRQCTECFFYYDLIEKTCPNCGFIPEIKQNVLIEDINEELQEIKEIQLDFREPKDCKNMSELYELAKNRGFKKGWAYYQGKLLGYL